jgi:hypothetical protein
LRPGYAEAIERRFGEFNIDADDLVGILGIVIGKRPLQTVQRDLDRLTDEAGILRPEGLARSRYGW